MLDAVQEYYGNTLQNSEDLQTNACCTAGAPPKYIRNVLEKIHTDVSSRYYGCGLIVPEALTGLKILDLGCGAGQDVYILSALVGETGTVIGVDMTPQQLDVARKHQDFHAQQFGHTKSNVQFIEGELEKLEQLYLEPNSFDLIVSNCVINLCVDKPAVLKRVYDLLKPGGEMYFSDVYSDKRIPKALQLDPVLYGECLSGAFYWNDFITTAKQCGFLDPRLESDSEIEIHNEDLAHKLGNIRFYSATYRLFKLEQLESECEDYGQAVMYKGSIEQYPQHLKLDKHHLFETNKIALVCGNTYRMLQETRFKQHFDFMGSFDRHFGIFKGCGTELPYTTDKTDLDTCC